MLVSMSGFTHLSVDNLLTFESGPPRPPVSGTPRTVCLCGGAGRAARGRPRPAAAPGPRARPRVGPARTTGAGPLRARNPRIDYGSRRDPPDRVVHLTATPTSRGAVSNRSGTVNRTRSTRSTLYRRGYDDRVRTPPRGRVKRAGRPGARRGGGRVERYTPPGRRDDLTMIDRPFDY